MKANPWSWCDGVLSTLPCPPPWGWYSRPPLPRESQCCCFCSAPTSCPQQPQEEVCASVGRCAETKQLSQSVRSQHRVSSVQQMPTRVEETLSGRLFETKGQEKGLEGNPQQLRKGYGNLFSDGQTYFTRWITVMCGSKMKGTASVWILKTTGGAFKPFPTGTGEKPQLRLKVRDKHLGCGPLTRSLKDRLETLPTALQTQQEGERFSKAVLRVRTETICPTQGGQGGKKK